MKKVLLVVALLFAVGCTDSFYAGIKSIGKPHNIRMYSGGELVAEWTSTGKVATIEQSDGWQFMDSKTRQLVRVGGDVIIEVKK
jgi:hypothetical protein